MSDLVIRMLRSTLRLLAVALLLPLDAAAQPVPEYELKAAFVYNFALFTEWPADTAYEGGSLNICINPASVLRQSLSGFGEKTVRGRRVAVRHLAALDSLRTCHVLFVDGSDRERWVQIKKGLGEASVLTISDDEEIGHDGSIVALAVDNNRIVFDVDTRAARQARLTLSSKLLRLARTVQ
ncbi:YfiR family protein [Noviherbaspirillum sp. ST9]|uniref:YfiR family protein n=1 Tax=Noviherbaspirillum sp. ST9 TaxID=3401606 RepID=UPI003B586414